MDGTIVLFYLVWSSLLGKVADGKENPYEMEEYLWHHQVKKTFCGLIEKERVYQAENLEIYCAAKVKIFQNQVKKLLVAELKTNFCYAASSILMGCNLKTPSVNQFIELNSSQGCNLGATTRQYL